MSKHQSLPVFIGQAISNCRGMSEEIKAIYGDSTLNAVGMF
jgi:hypothetical protein